MLCQLLYDAVTPFLSFHLTADRCAYLPVEIDQCRIHGLQCFRVAQSSVVHHPQRGCRLVSKQAAVTSVVFVAVQTMFLDHVGSSSQRCCDGRIANVWQRLDENFLDFFQCEAVIEPRG